MVLSDTVRLRKRSFAFPAWQHVWCGCMTVWCSCLLQQHTLRAWLAVG